MNVFVFSCMEKYQIVEGCILFSKDNSRYLYGLTWSLLLSSRLQKIKVDCLVIPSSPYKALCFRHAAIDLLLCQLLTAETASISNNQYAQFTKHLLVQLKQVILPNKATLRQILSIKIKTGSQELIAYYPDHQINEKQLITMLEKENLCSRLFTCGIDANRVPVWINNPRSELKVIVPEVGMTTYVCLQTDVVVVNPTHHYVADLLFKFGHSQKSVQFSRFVHTVIVSKYWSVYAVLSLLLIEQEGQFKPIRVILTSKRLEQLLLKVAYKQLGYPEDIVRNKLWIRTIGSDYRNIVEKISEYDGLRLPILQGQNSSKESSAGGSGSLYLLHTESQPSQKPRFQLIFGSSVSIKSNLKIIFYEGQGVKSQLAHIPSQLQNLTNSCIICYGMRDNISKQLKVMPSELRKKIILNRQDHKFNHKYFMTFTTDSSLADPGPINHYTIIDINALQLRQGSSVAHFYGLGMGSKISCLKDKQKISGGGHYFKVLKGIVCYEQGGKTVVKGVGQQILKAVQVMAQGPATLALYSDSDINIKNNREGEQIVTDHLKNIENNSFIQKLSQQQRTILNKICSPITFQVGNKIEQKAQCAYFIIKGGLTWDKRNQVATSGHFIGNLRSLTDPNSGMRLGDIEVVKDTWTLQIRLPELYEHFFMRYPFYLHEMQERGQIFN